MRGLDGNIKQKRVSAFINELKPGILMLQETHSHRDSNLVLKNKKIAYQIHSKGNSKARRMSHKKYEVPQTCF